MATPGQPLTWDDPDLRYDDPRLRWGQPFPSITTSMDNRISSALTDADVTAITEAIAVIRGRLGFLIHLTADQRKKMAKGGTMSEGITQDSLTFAANNPNAFPGDFDRAEFAKDGALLAKFRTVIQAVASLNEDVDDTRMVLEGELYLQMLSTYAFAKVNNRNGQYDSFINLLKPYFARPRHTPATPPPGP